jgi:hypothetical protein
MGGGGGSWKPGEPEYLPPVFGEKGQKGPPEGERILDCPSDFRAEIQDIAPADCDWAADFTPGTLLEVVLSDGDPQFVLGGRTVGWLSTNRDAVVRCIAAGWTYSAEVLSNRSSAAGPIIETRVQGAEGA